MIDGKYEYFSFISYKEEAFLIPYKQSSQNPHKLFFSKRQFRHRGVI